MSKDQEPQANPEGVSGISPEESSNSGGSPTPTSSPSPASSSSTGAVTLQPSPKYDVVIIVGVEPEKKRATVAKGIQELKKMAESQGLYIKIINEQAGEISNTSLFSEISALHEKIGKDTLIELAAHGGTTRLVGSRLKLKKQHNTGLDPLVEFAHSIVDDPTTKSMVIHADAGRKLNYSCHGMKQYVMDPDEQSRYVKQQLTDFSTSPVIAEASATIAKAKANTSLLIESSAEEQALRIQHTRKTVSKEISSLAEMQTPRSSRMGYNAKSLIIAQSGQKKKQLDKTLDSFHTLSDAEKFKRANAIGYISENGVMRTFANALHSTKIANDIYPYTIDFLIPTSQSSILKGTTQYPIDPPNPEKSRKILSSLLEASKTDPSLLEIRDVQGNTLLHRAITNNDTMLVTELLTRNVNPNAQGGNGETALHTAVKKQDESLVLMLLRAGASPDITDTKGFSPLSDACMRPNSNIVLGCLAFAKDVPNNSIHRDLLHRAAGHHPKDIIEALIDSGIDPNTRDTKEGFTPLHTAVLRNNMKAIHALLDAGINPDIQGTHNGITALHIAAGMDWKDAVKVLLERKANPTLLDKDGNTAADMASPSVKALLEMAATPRLLNPSPETPLPTSSTVPAATQATPSSSSSPLAISPTIEGLSSSFPAAMTLLSEDISPTPSTSSRHWQEKLSQERQSKSKPNSLPGK